MSGSRFPLQRGMDASEGLCGLCALLAKAAKHVALIFCACRRDLDGNGT